MKKGDRVKLKGKNRTGTVIKASMANAYEVLVCWDDTKKAEFVKIYDLERMKEDGKD